MKLKNYNNMWLQKLLVIFNHIMIKTIMHFIQFPLKILPTYNVIILVF